MKISNHKYDLNGLNELRTYEIHSFFHLIIKMKSGTNFNNVYFNFNQKRNAQSSMLQYAMFILIQQKESFLPQQK